MKNRPPPGAPKENMTSGRAQKMIPVKFIARQSVPRNEREYLPAIVVESEDPHVAAAPKVSMLVENGRIHAIAGNAVFYPEGFHASARSEEHTSELQSLMRISYAVFCLKKKTKPVYQTISDDKQLIRTKQITIN